MEVRTINFYEARVAKLKLHVIQQQGLAAEFFRQGDLERARQARSRLLYLEFQLDVVQTVTDGLRCLNGNDAPDAEILHRDRGICVYALGAEEANVTSETNLFHLG
jgi:hypothetical protein